MGKIQLIAAVGFQRNIAFNQCARVIWTLGAGVANLISRTLPHGASSAHMGSKTLAAVAAKANHVHR